MCISLHPSLEIQNFNFFNIRVGPKCHISLHIQLEIQFFFLIFGWAQKRSVVSGGTLCSVFRCKGYVKYIFFIIFFSKNYEMLTRVDIKFLGHFAAKYVAFLGIKKNPPQKRQHITAEASAVIFASGDHETHVDFCVNFSETGLFFICY